MDDGPDIPEFRGSDFLVSMMRNAIEFDGRALTARENPEALRALLDECFGPEVLMNSLDAKTVMDRLFGLVMEHDPAGAQDHPPGGLPSRRLFEACRDLIGQMAAQQAKRQFNALLYKQMELPDDFDDRALSLRDDEDGLKRYLADTVLPKAPSDWSEETRAAVVDRYCRAVVDHDPDGSTPLLMDCTMALQGLSDASGQPVVRIRRIQGQNSRVVATPRSFPLSPPSSSESQP